MSFSLQKELLLLGIGSLTIAVSLLIRKRLSTIFKEEAINEEQNYYHTFFTTVENVACRPDVNARKRCSKKCCSYSLLQNLCSFLSSAESTISLCMYTASLESVFQELYAAHKRGVHVRIITDFEMTRLNSSIFHAFQSTGVVVKNQGLEKNNMMHHKFCLVDECDPIKGKLFFGSLNLTMLGICGNFEHVMFTNDRNFVDRFTDEFEYLWQKF